MANSLYDLGREKFLRGEISWNADNIKVVLVDTDTYAVDLATDEFLSDIPDVEEVATSGNLTTKTTTAGVADAADVTFTSVTGDPSEALVIFKDTGSQATSPLIAYLDDATGLFVTPNGGDIQTNWNGSGIFKL